MIVSIPIDQRCGERHDGQRSRQGSNRDGRIAWYGAVVFKHQDVSSEERWTEIVAEVEQEHGGIDVLVNNAGIVIVGMPEQTTLEDFRKQNAVMNEGVFLGCKAVIPAMRKRGGGSIINMSSIASHVGYPVFFAYSAAKGAVRAMTKSLQGSGSGRGSRRP